MLAANCAPSSRAADDGQHVAPTKLTVAEHVRARLEQWRVAGAISPKTHERYNELIENQIVPFIGTLVVQKLKPLDIETWHSTLRPRAARAVKVASAPARSAMHTGS